MSIYYFGCPVCGKSTPLTRLEFPEDDGGVFTIQEREAAGRGGFPTVAEYDALEFEDEEIIARFAQRIEQIYDNLVEHGYINDEDEEEDE